VFAAAYSDFAGLSMRMRLVDLAVGKMRAQSRRWWVIVAAVAIVSASAALLGVAHAFSADLGVASAASAVAWLAALVTGALVVLAASPILRFLMRRLRKGLADDVDGLFDASYRRETAVGSFDDLVQRWRGIKAETIDIIARAPLSLPFFSARKRAAVDAVAADLLSALAKNSSK